MKKKLISAAILLGASGVVWAAPAINTTGSTPTVGSADPDKAMVLNGDGLGQVLFYPYYNVNEGFDTAFTVVNTSGTYRAVKVRIFEGKNSWEVLDFNLYMSPYDTWQGMLHKHEDGKVELITADTSCTLPKLNNPDNPAYLRAVDGNITEIEGTQDRPVSLFTNKRYKNQDEREAEYADPANLIKRISEGYVEVIDMGAIWDGLTEDQVDALTANDYAKINAYNSIVGIDTRLNAPAAATPTADETADANAAKKKLKGKIAEIPALKAAITHTKDGVPADCAHLDKFAHKVWEAGNPDYYIVNDQENVLSGSATLINVKKGMAGSYNAVAVKNFVLEDPALGVATASGTTAYAARNYKPGQNATPRAYTLHNVPSSSYPNINGQVQRIDENTGKGTVVYSTAINPNVLVTHNGGTYEPLTVNDALYNGTDTYNAQETNGLVLPYYSNDVTITPASITGPQVYPAAVSLTAIMMAQKVIGEYVIDPDLKAASDWIITMPTKHYFTNPNTTRPSNVSRGLGQYGFLKDGPDAYRPFLRHAFDAGSPLADVATIVTYNREEGNSTITHEFDFSPSIGLNETGMNAEANVLHFSKDEEKKIFTSSNEHMLNVKEDFKAGWAMVSFNKQFLTNLTGVLATNLDGTCKSAVQGANSGSYCFRGLPVVGVVATKYVNSTLYVEGIGDVLSNYMGIVDLTYKRNNTVKP